MALTRLDKLLADSGRCSRAEAKALLRAGRITVNGALPRRADEKYDAETAEVYLDGERLNCAPLRYVLLHKPAGWLSATEDRDGPVVTELLPPELRALELFPVGRLDKDVTGLLLLTNDGALAHSLLSPRRHVPKVYLAVAAAPLDAEDAVAFRAGMTLGDGTRCRPAELAPDPEDPCRCRVTLHEGKYHQVKRMFAARGKPLTALSRVAFGPLELDARLAPGACRELTAAELTALRAAAGT